MAAYPPPYDSRVGGPGASHYDLNPHIKPRQQSRWGWEPPYATNTAGHNPANQPDMYQNREGYNEYGMQTGIEGDVNYRLNLGVDPALMDYGSLAAEGNPYANRDYQMNLRMAAQAGQADAFTRAAQENEMSAYHLEQMLGSDSPLMRRARMSAMAGAAGRGLMNSSIAQGAAQGAMIDRAQPFALQDAAMHQRAATESLAAQNQAALTNAQLRTQAGVANMQGQAGLDQAAMNARAMMDRDIFGADVGGQQDAFRHLLGMETREDQQQWQESQNRLDRELKWNSDRQAAIENWSTREMELMIQAGATREQALAQILSGIYSNPDLTAAEQQAAAANARRIMGDVYNNPTGSAYPIPGSTPPWMQQGGGQQPPPNVPPPDVPPPDAPPPGTGDAGGGGGDFGGRPPASPEPDPDLPPDTANLMGMGTAPQTTAQTTALNKATGQVYTSTSNPSAQKVTEALPPIF